MKRTMRLLATTVVAVLLLAPAAMAVPSTPPHLQPNITNTPGAGLGGYDPQLFGTPNAPGAGDVAPAPADSAVPDEQYASPSEPANQDSAGQDQYAAAPLPDTGGPSSALLVALALVACGFGALRFVLRRSTAS